MSVIVLLVVIMALLGYFLAAKALARNLAKRLGDPEVMFVAGWTACVVLTWFLP